MVNPGWPGKLSWGKTLVVACCCWEPWLARKTSADCCCRFVAADGESWLARKTRLGKDACRCLLLLGTLVSQENCCWMLLQVGSCWWGILVGQEKLDWGMLLVGGDAEWPERNGGLGRPKYGWGASTAWLGAPIVKPWGLTSGGLGRPKLCWDSSTPWLGVASVNHGVQPLRLGWVDQKFAGVPPLPSWGVLTVN